ncbi:nitrogen regulatory protein otam [Phlyctema vagabunda]|uniref:Nitrogen regulatory protein otam n=1 Tax=Phlyctema vagabunda TaxID=108571 RepID=A0ABR4PPF0_9HELO
MLQDSTVCITCQSRAEECTFVEVPQRRKRRKLDTGAGSLDSTKPQSPNTEIGTRAKEPLNDYTKLQGSLLTKTLGLQNRQHGQYLGLTTEYDTRLINLSPFDGRGESVGVPGTLRRVSQKTHFLMKADVQAEVDGELAYLDAVENIIQPHGKALVDLYFRIVHPSFPIMHKRVFLEKYNRTYREFTPPILAAVYILALHWWNYSPDLVSLPKPDVRELEKLVPKIMSDVLDRSKLSTVQAGLLLLQRPDGDSWALTGQLVAVGQNLGLHLDCSKWKIPEWERGLRKRLGWALFMQDKWGALIHGRPSHILQDNWAVKPVDTKDFPETADDDDEEEGSSEVEKGRLLFIHMISLTQILADILDTFFTLKAATEMENGDNNALMATLEKAKPLQLRLKDWYTTLPSCLAIGETRARKLSSTGYLHLAYFAAEMSLHRAIIRFDTSNPDKNLRLITRGAAKMRFTSAIEFVKKLEPAHLQSFWYFASKVNLAIVATFGSILWATSDNAEECDYYRSQLAEYRWTLRVSSNAAEFMKFTVGMLDSSAVFLKEGSRLSASPAIARDVHDNDEESDESDNDNDNDNNNDGEPTRSSNQSSSKFNGTPNVEKSSLTYETAVFNGVTNLESQPSMSWPTFDTPEQWEDAGFNQDWAGGGSFNYTFENLQGVQDLVGHRRIIQEFDESRNGLAEF